MFVAGATLPSLRYVSSTHKKLRSSIDAVMCRCAGGVRAPRRFCAAGARDLSGGISSVFASPQVKRAALVNGVDSHDLDERIAATMTAAPGRSVA